MFIDTNMVENKGSATFFFGGRNDLEKIAKRADIGVPRVVYDELCRHISSFLKGQRDSFKRNPYRHLLEIDEKKVDLIIHDELIATLVKNEKIGYEIIDLIDENRAYKEAYVHALEGTPPFEAKGDKGFKDTLIAKTIDQYIEQNSDRTVFLLTGDGRLAEYFDDSNVTVIKDFGDFDREYSEDKMEEAWLQDRVRTYLADEWILFDEPKIESQWLSVDDNIVCTFKVSDEKNVTVLVDSNAREPVSHTYADVKRVAKELSGVSSFQEAHDTIASASDILAYLSVGDVERVTRSMIDNSQIYGIGTDDDIAEFAAQVFGVLDENGHSELAEGVKNRYNLLLLTSEQKADLPF